MSDSDSGSEDFNFKSNVDFDAKQEEKERFHTNDLNFKTLSEICNTFYDDIQKNDFFDHKSAWRSSSSIEPIKIKISAQETLPGICDLIKPSKHFYNKVLTALSTLILEVDNILPNIGITNYESLYCLSVYGQEISKGGEDEKQVNDEEIKIARMLPYFNEIKENIDKLLTLAINLLKQLASLYSEKNQDYSVSYRFYNFGLAFEYIGKILSYFLAIDNIVEKNETLKEHWDKYRKMVFQSKNNDGELNITEEQRKKLNKYIKKINAPLFEGTCYSQCAEIIQKKSGEISASGQGMIPLSQCKIFLRHFELYMTSRIKKLYNNLDKLSESYEPIEIFQFLSLLGFYIKLTNNNSDKNILKSAWQVQKKIANINIVGISSFNIESFLNGFEDFKKISLDPPSVDRNMKSNLTSLEKQFHYMISNFNSNIITWVTNMDSLFSNSKDFSSKASGNPKLIDNTNKKIKLIIEGLCTANYLRNKIAFILDSHLSFGDEVKLDEQIIIEITSALELIKVIEFEFSKIMNLISLNIPLLTRGLLTPIQDAIKKVAEKANKKYRDGKSTNEQLYKDALSASNIFYICSQGIQSQLRLVIEKLCFSTMTAKELLDEENYNLINDNIWMIEMISQLSREIKRCCDCSFLYLYQDILPIAFKNILSDRPKRLYYFIMAINDIENPLHYLKCEENDGIEIIKLLRKITFDTFENYFLKNLSQEIENDLRVQVHGTFIEGLEGAPYSDNNFKTYLNIKKFRFFDKVVDIKRYIEEQFNIEFYKHTTLHLNDFQIYQRMRVLAKNKYGLNLHEVYLPNQNLEQGKDLLEIARSISTFAKNYTYNLHHQQFIEKVKDSSYLNIIGVQQIISSLYTHGKGIVNSIVNKAYEFIAKNIGILIDILKDEYINSMLREEMKFWEENKAKINYNYPLDRGQNLRQNLINNDQNKKNGTIKKCITNMTQIGNVVSLIRCIRTALMDYNSQNVTLLTTYNTNDFYNLLDRISLQPNDDPKSQTSQISQNMITNTQNSLIDSSKLFCNTISSLKETGENELNYLEILVNAFRDSITLEQFPYIDLLAFLLPPVTLTFIDNAINARDNLLKKTKTEDNAYFSDDGFIMGMCYLLKLFYADKKFESLNWFPSVIEFYNSKKADKKKNKHSNGVDILNNREIASYKEQFELQYFTYTSASLLFTD